MTATGGAWAYPEPAPNLSVAGTYNYWVSLKDSGCEGPCTPVYIGVDTCEATALSSISGAYSITVYPNPCNDVINVRAPGKTTVRIYNVMGQLLKETENTGHISITELPAGMYFIKIHDEQNQLIHQDKIVKQ